MKTPHESEPEGGTSSSANWWRADIPGETESLARLMLAHHTKGIGGGASPAEKMLPTLTVCGNYNRKGLSPTSGNGLATALRLLPTLAATDYKSAYSAAGYKKKRLKRSKLLRDTLVHDAGIPLTATFAEWFMGWPIGHTALGASAMVRSRSVPPLPGESLVDQ